MSRYDETFLEIRKLRKKLRQIENLETLERDLDQFEIDKVDAKPEFRARLLELVATQSEALNLDDEEDAEQEDESYETEMLEQILNEYDEAPNIEHDTATQSGSQEKVQIPDESVLLVVTESLPPVDANPVVSVPLPEEPPTKKAKQAPKQKKELKKYQKLEFVVKTIEGHNDLVNSVALNKDYFISGSRDTTLKVWDSRSGLSISHLGGHTGAVSAVLLLDPSVTRSTGIECEEDVVISGSSDCSIRIWRAASGECIKSIYVFNPVTSMALLPVNDSHCLLIGSAGGKLEMWSLAEEFALQTFRTDEEKSITGIDVEGHHVYSCSASGLIRVYELRNETLHLINESENAKTSSSSGPLYTFRPIHTIGVSHQMVYYGDSGMNLKVLDWKKGQVSRLSHHNMEYGLTDSIKCNAHLILASGYDLDNGVGYVNVRDAASSKYLYTLCDEDSSRILCLDSCCYGDVVSMVTGGFELKLWTQVNRNTSVGSEDVVVTSQCIPQFSRQARHSDVESDGETSEADLHDDDPSDPPLPWQHKEETEVHRGWFSSCAIL